MLLPKRVPKFYKLCKCLCGKIIEWKDHYRLYGIPNYIKGHSNLGI